MLRSGFLLGVGGPAAILTLLVLPSVRASADRLVIPQIALTQTSVPTAYVPPYLPGARVMSFEVAPAALSADRFSTPPRVEMRTAPVVPASTGPTASEKDTAKPRRLTREGCETPLSSLVGPEARRMVPGRCMA